MSKMRVWWIPQVGVSTAFYVPVETVEEAKKVMDLLGAYDCFQFNHNIKPDYCNAGGLEVWDEDEQEWIDWEHDSADAYYDDVDEYCEEQSSQAAELRKFAEELYLQVTFD